MGNYGRWAEEVGSDVVRSTTLLPLPRDQHPRAYMKDTTTVGTHQFSGLTSPTWGSLGNWTSGWLGERVAYPSTQVFFRSPPPLPNRSHWGVNPFTAPQPSPTPSQHFPTSITPIPNDVGHPCYNSQTRPRNLTPPHSHATFHYLRSSWRKVLALWYVTSRTSAVLSPLMSATSLATAPKYRGEFWSTSPCASAPLTTRYGESVSSNILPTCTAFRPRFW